MEFGLNWYDSVFVGILFFYVLLQCFACCARTTGREEEELSSTAAAGDGVGDATSTWPHSDGNEALDGGVLASLPVFVYASSDNEMKQLDPCAVCLVEYEDGEKGRQLLPCFHCFHVDCIDMWLSSHSTCPLCRSLVGSLAV